MSGSDVKKVKDATNPKLEAKTTKIPMAEIKNGKVYFRQKPISFEKQSETLQEIVKFREMLEGRIEQNSPPLDAIPEEHKPLIAKLAHESDKSLAALSKQIHHELLPAQDDEERDNGRSPAAAALPINVVEAAINEVVQRNNYGLDGISGGRVPAALCVWRWEVKAQHRDWLPKIGREKADTRLAERIQAKHDLLSLFRSFPQAEQDAMLDPKGKLPSKEINIPDTTQPIDLTVDVKFSSHDFKKSPKKQIENEENDAQSEDASSKAGKTKKPIDPEKAAKEKERLEKKAAKAEKEKKEKDAQNKSRSLMANFFAKPKAPAQPKEKEQAVAGPSNVQSDFGKSFRPFVLKKDTRLAPINWFLEYKKAGRTSQATSLYDGVILIDDEEETKQHDVEMQDIQADEIDVAGLSNEEHLKHILSKFPPSASPRGHCHRGIPHLKTYQPIAVRDLVTQLSEAEIAGDVPVVRSILSTLSNRSALPARVFIFTEDARPGYFGTWTRSSRIIGPRTPFAKDVLVFDYGYDSGEEWEEEPVGDADDVVEDGEDEDVGADDADSDLESWLVDDEEEPEISLEDRDASPLLIPEFPQPTKRKAEDSEKKIGKRRKVVIPLVPFAKGPCWESSIGQCEHDLFKPYRIQLFNDTPFPIDPFTYVSTCVEDKRASEKAVASGDGMFAVPTLPGRLIPSQATDSPSAQTSTPPKKGALVPKIPFPDAHLPFLLGKIQSLQAASITFLVEAIHRELREHKVKKNAIEAKVREVGEKCKQKKFWVIKPDIQQISSQSQTAVEH